MTTIENKIYENVVWPYRLIGNLNIVNSPDIVYKDSIIFAKFVEKK